MATAVTNFIYGKKLDAPTESGQTHESVFIEAGSKITQKDLGVDKEKWAHYLEIGAIVEDASFPPDPMPAATGLVQNQAEAKAPATSEEKATK